MQATTYALLLPIMVFALGTSITPGPNNLMLTASGANFGFRRTVPHLLGVAIGFPVMVIAVGLGLASLFERLPRLHELMKYAGIVYLLWLSFKIATAKPMREGKPIGKSLKFLQAAAFQWINPKAWTMALSAVATYTTVRGNVLGEILIIAAIFAIVSFPCAALWTGFGVALQQVLTRRPAYLRGFNFLMALLLVASVSIFFG